jgi:hypothetical protein
VLTKEEISKMFPIQGKIAQRVTGVASEVAPDAPGLENHAMLHEADIDQDDEDDEEDLFLSDIQEIESRHEHDLDGWDEDFFDDGGDEETTENHFD